MSTRDCPLTFPSRMQLHFAAVSGIICIGVAWFSAYSVWREGNMARRLVLGVVLAVVFAAGSLSPAAEPEKTEKDVEKAKNPVVVIETSKGTIKVELWADKAPVTVANFLSYVDKKFYDGLIFHRVIKGFMAQGGGFTPDMKQKQPDKPIKNEATADKANDRGTLAMARTNVVDSATSQFFINLVDNKFLNHEDNTSSGFGYCAFGKVLDDGMKVVDEIGKVETGNRGGYNDVPVEPVIIKGIRRAE